MPAASTARGVGERAIMEFQHVVAAVSNDEVGLGVLAKTGVKHEGVVSGAIIPDLSGIIAKTRLAGGGSVTGSNGL